MCGIFGAININPVTGSLLTGLQNLAYRGYDSAGIAVIGRKGLERRRAQGKLDSLTAILKNKPLDGTIGIAHTRWATHGAANVVNAHPHMTAQVAVVHNGIIENYQALRTELEREGYDFQSDTDSETIPLLISRNLDHGMTYRQAIEAALALLVGSFAVAIVFNDCPDEIFVARRGSPLVVGEAEGGFYLASDSNALGGISHAVCHLEDGDIAGISRDKIDITDANGMPVVRAMQAMDVSESGGDKNGYRHYMLKEIHEQAGVLKQTTEHYLKPTGINIELPPLPFSLKRLQRLNIIACGTSYYAGLVAKYWMESYAGISVNVDIASEYRYRQTPLSDGNAALFISQSGETADTLAALEYSKTSNQHCVSIVNVINSTIARVSDALMPTLAGPEIGVASTKAFTSQLTVLLFLTLGTAHAKGLIDGEEARRQIEQLKKLPQIIDYFLANNRCVQRIAAKLQRANSVLYLGRGAAFPLALEGALKLKETSYIHAEAFPAGELKHGPIALIDEHMPVIIIAPPGPLFEKSLSNLREVASRGAKVILVSNECGVAAAGAHIDDALVMPDVEPLLQPLLYTLPLQLLAYHVAVLKGTDVDQPRNLAKSVTVE